MLFSFVGKGLIFSTPPPFLKKWTSTKTHWKKILDNIFFYFDLIFDSLGKIVLMRNSSFHSWTWTRILTTATPCVTIELRRPFITIWTYEVLSKIRYPCNLSLQSFIPNGNFYYHKLDNLGVTQIPPGKS